MITFFKKLFKRGDFMTRADKWYYSKVIKTWLWSAFAFVIIAWVGTNLVLCALSMNVKSGGDLIYEAPARDVVLPIGQELNKVIKNSSTYDKTDNTIKTITFDKYTENKTYFAGGGQKDLIAGITPETVNAQDGIYLYRLNNGADIYILSKNTLYANPDLSCAFYELRSLTNIYYNNFHKTDIEKLSYTFYYCQSLTSWNELSNWNISKVQSLACTFYQCRGFTSLTPIGGWDVSNVTSMSHIFAYCNFTSLTPISGWDVSNVTNMAYMFDFCEFTSLRPISGWNVSNVLNMGSMFFSCYSVTSLDDLSEWNVGSVTNMGYMFDGCPVTSLDGISGWNVSNVTNMAYMFSDAEFESVAPIEKWNRKNLKTIQGMFRRCDNLSTVDLSGWDASGLTDIGALFIDCKGLITVDLSTWDTANVTSFNSMFSGCENLVTIYASSKFHVDVFATSNFMFTRCTSLVGGKGTKWDSSHTDRTYARIDDPDNGRPGYFTQK